MKSFLSAIESLDAVNNLLSSLDPEEDLERNVQKVLQTEVSRNQKVLQTEVSRNQKVLQTEVSRNQKVLQTEVSRNHILN